MDRGKRHGDHADVHHGTLLRKEQRLHVCDTIRTQSDNPTLSTEDHLLPMGYCSHTYAQGRAASVSTATPEVKPHLTGGKEFKRMDSSSQVNKERKTSNTRPHHFTNKHVFSASCAHFYKVQLRFQRQKCCSRQEHRVTLLWIERKKRLFGIGLIKARSRHLVM